MSWEKKPDGRYLVRWRDSAGRSRSKTVYRQRDAISLDGEMKRKRSMGELIAHERGDTTLAEFWAIWKQDYGAVNVSTRTLAVYDRFWSGHIDPAIGHYRLNAISPERIVRLVAALNRTLAPATTQRILGMLQGVLERAVEWRYIQVNPCRGVKRPPAESRRGRALTPDQLAAICAELSPRSRTVALVLAWTGLRPGELRALTWAALSSTHIRVEQAASNDVIGPTKTRRRRSVDLTPEARKTLLEWFMASGQPAASALIFPAATGGLWLDGAYSRWGQRRWRPAVARAGLPGIIPYDLRHTFASRLIDEGKSVIEVARQMGHTPTQTLETYAHEFEQQRKSVASECHANPSIREILSAGG